MSASVNKVKIGIVVFAVAAAVGVCLAAPQSPQRDAASQAVTTQTPTTTMSGNVEFRLESLG